MPRYGSDNASRSRAPRPERDRTPDRRPPVNVDDRALSLREGNASYSAIARRLELRRAADAHRAFIRAVSCRSGDEQRKLVANEHARLDQLESRIRDRDAADPEKVQRRLQAVDTLRTSLP